MVWVGLSAGLPKPTCGELMLYSRKKLGTLVFMLSELSKVDG